MPNIIEVNHLLKRYPGSEQPAVNHVSFAVRRGEIFGLLGPIDAGKTTTLSMLAGLLKPSGGSATVAGFDLFRQSKDIKRRCKFVPQKLALVTLLSIQDNLLLYGYRHGIHGRQLRTRIAEAVQLAGLDAGRRDRVGNYSCGMQRRISLAAALLHQPEILCLDGPTLNVDLQSSNGILQIVTELNGCGLTVVYATRDGDEAARLCHRVALIDQGRIIALDTPRALQDLVKDGSLDLNLNTVFLELTGRRLQA